MRSRLFLALLLSGCFERTLEPVDPCTRSQEGFVEYGQEVDSVDLLLMIDDSSSMAAAQAAVAEQIPRIVRILVTGEREDADDFNPVRSLHIGIVSSDMGVGDVTSVPSCGPGFGDDGLLRTLGCGSDEATTYPGGVFDFWAGGASTPESFGADVACVVALGTGGCGFEQSLEAPLKALSPAPRADGSSPVSWTRFGYVPPTFLGETYGHGDDPGSNGGFLRPDSVLAVVVVSDEDDCSTSHPQIFSVDDPRYASEPIDLRCHAFADQLYAPERYVDGLLGLRANPSMLVYAAIAGIPPEVAGSDPTAILADPSMQEQLDATGQHLLPSCASANGVAYPARRITSVAQQLAAAGAGVSLRSICKPDLTGAFDAILDDIAFALTATCLARELRTDADGFVDCDMTFLLPEGERCDDLAPEGAYGFVRIETISSAGGMAIQRELCSVRQVGRVGAGTVSGWAYDTGDVPGWSRLPYACTQRLGFSVLSPPDGVEVRFACNETILAPTHLGDFCGPTMPACEGPATIGNPIPLSCDPFTHACGIACAVDADCAAAGLLADVCDMRAASAYFSSPPSDLSPTATHGFCVNPTCGL